MTLPKKTIFVTLAVILIVSTIVFANFEMSQKEADGQQVPAIPVFQERTVSSTGSATASVLPDLVTVQFGVDTQEKTAQDSINENSQMTNAIVNALENIGISKDEISTSDFSISPVYNDSIPDQTTGIHQSELIGYQTSNTLYVKTTKLSMAGNITDTAVSAGANRVDSIFFSLSPEKEQSMQDDLINKAVLDAKSRAETAIDPLGQKIIGVKTVNLSDFNAPPPPIYPGAMSAMADRSTPIFSSNQQVTTTVNVIFLIGDQ
ncbi:MAG: SIMPL domain-containing protein [Nitrosotalea sp.]